MPQDPWKSLAEKEPYFSVLTEERFRGEPQPHVLEEFFATGKRDFETILSAARAIEPSFAPTSFLDYGCGVGRILVHAADVCAEAVGVDVAPAMLEVAREHLRERRLENVRLLPPTQFTLSTERFDLVNCYLVLQHIPPREGMSLLRELVRRVRTGGFLSLHVLYWREGGLARRYGRWLRRTLPAVNRIFGGSEYMQMNVYDSAAVLRILQSGGFSDSRMKFTDHGGMLGVHVIAGPRGAN